MNSTLVLLGVGSDGQTVEQWDGHRPPAGVMLRWFPPDDLGFPDFGFDVYRAFVNDMLPFRFDNAAVAGMAGRKHVLVDDRIELDTTDPAGLLFQPYLNANALILRPGARLVIGFVGRAWDLSLGATQLGSGLTIEGYAAGVSRGSRQLPPGGQVNWRTYGLDRIELTGDGAIAHLGYRFVDAPYQWVRLGHRSLPVSHAGYPDPAKPAPGAEEAEARSRLPTGPAADWAVTYGAGFPDLLRTLTALALHQSAPALPTPANPDEPRLSASGAELLRAALIDPHIGRIAGLAWDDRTAATLNQLVAYKVVGRWPGGTFAALVGEAALAELAPEVLPPGERPVPLAEASGSYDTDLGASGILRVRLGIVVDRLDVELSTVGPAVVVARDNAGNALAKASVVGGGMVVAALKAAAITNIDVQGSGIVSVAGFRWRVKIRERYGLIPGIDPTDPGPPDGPSWVTASMPAQGESRRAEAELDWDTATATTAGASAGAVGVQIAGRRFASDPSKPAPAVPAFQRNYLLRGESVAVVAPAQAARPSPRALMLDAGPVGDGLAEGWHAWWVRGVDLFGRCAVASPAATLAVTDDAPPPAPSVVLAEYVQADLPGTLLTVLGRSPLAAQWLAAHPGTDALTCCLAWTPELAALAPDVDTFRVYVRRPVRQVPATPRDPTESYSGVAWATAVGEVGPVPTRLAGTVASVRTVVNPIAVSAVTTEPDGTYRCTTDLGLDAGSGDLTGTVLTAGTTSWNVVGNGTGTAVTLLVAAAASPPVPGTFRLDRGTSGVLVIDAGIAAPNTGDPFRRACAGTITAVHAGVDHRYRVLGTRGAALICADDDEPAPGTGSAAAWYPAWTLTLRDTGFGPLTDSVTPVARAQVCVTAVRRGGTPRAVESARSAQATVLRVDATVPPTPTLPALPAGEHCARLASAADWYGISRFTLPVTTASDLRYIVLRALADTVYHRDHVRRAQPGYQLDLSAPWMADLLSGTRGQVVTADLAALAAAGADPDAADAAYTALHTDTARIIAAQSWTKPAYTQRRGAPLTAADLPYIDEFEGRSRSHWFYRVAARSPAGVESGWSAPTPPICSPDVIPPPTPITRLALAADRAVTVSWLPAPGGVDHYLLYRGRDDAALADPRDLSPVRTVPATALNGTPVQVTVGCDPGPWSFRVVAVDAAGNRSRPSEILAGHALLPPPDAPEWIGATRSADAIKLSWKPGGAPAADPRLACLVERRPAGEGFWSAVSGWLPRAVYAFTDRPADPDAAWDYRLRVRDDLGQVAADLPDVTVPEA